MSIIHTKVWLHSGAKYALYSSGKLTPFQLEGKGLHRPECSSARLALL